MQKYTEEQAIRIRENALELYEILQEFLARYRKVHVMLDREFIKKVETVIDKCKGG